MKKRYYIGARLALNSIESLKVMEFKARNDFKFKNETDLTLPLLAPIELGPENLKSMIADLHEGAEDFFDGINNEMAISLRGIDFLSQRKKHLLFLDPWLPDELFFFREYMIESALAHREGKFDKVPEEKRKLAIGRYQHEEDLRQGLFMAQLEFDKPFSVQLKEVGLYRKTKGKWDRCHVLVEFNSNLDNAESFDLSRERIMIG